MITETMRQYLAAHPGLKYIFFGGKGGVGKTVLAGTAALWFADAGRKTLLASTNPVHSLSSMLDRDVFGKPTDIPEVPNLQAYEIDTRGHHRTSPSTRSAKRSSGSSNTPRSRPRPTSLSRARR